MAVYIVTGKLGTGKGKFCVVKMREALKQGRHVATNFDLNLDKLLPPSSIAHVSRVPDKPTAADLDLIGHGNPDTYDEDKNGVLVLDELGSWLNSRQYQDQHRKDLVDWLIHARKKGWDCYLIVQNLAMIDKQVREGLAEYLITCINARKIKLPVFGLLLGKYGRLPRFHVARTSLTEIPGVIIETDYFRADDVQPAYDTRQIFRNWHRDPARPEFHSEIYAGPYSYLSAWHLVGRFQPALEVRSFWHRLPLFAKPPRRPPPKPKLGIIGKLHTLPPDDAWRHARRLVQLGYTGGSSCGD